MTPDDRQSYYEDCHTWQDESDKTPGSAHKGCLSKGYRSSSSTRTYRTLEVVHNSIPDTGESIPPTITAVGSFYWIIRLQRERAISPRDQIKGFYKRP
jgi:hypothetical protein